jgi:hypothetical protein
VVTLLTLGGGAGIAARVALGAAALWREAGSGLAIRASAEPTPPVIGVATPRTEVSAWNGTGVIALATAGGTAATAAGGVETIPATGTARATLKPAGALEIGGTVGRVAAPAGWAKAVDRAIPTTTLATPPPSSMADRQTFP